MAVTYLEEKGLFDTCEMFQNSIKTFEGHVSDMKTITRDLLNCWEGIGSQEFQTQFRLMEGQLDDITDSLYDIYDALVDARTCYIDTDEAVAKEFSAAMA